MGKYDMCMKAYLQDKRRFADLFNGSCFQGRQVIRAEDLEEASESYVATEEKQPGKPLQKGTEIIRDVKMRYRSGMILQVLAVENQSYIDYGMPVRCMGYDAAEYSRQLKERKQERRLLARHKEETEKELKTTIDEKLSGILRSDRLHPIYTICLYSGEEPWDGPRKLSDMFGDVDEELLPFIPDYRINLLAPREITDFTGFRTSIRQLFEVLKNAYDKEKMQEVLQNDEKFSKVDRETVEAINLFAGTDIDIDEKEEVIDMCKAWEDQKNEGRELGERQKIISLVVKKLQKDKSVAEIADDLEEKEEVIAPIYEAALSMKPDYDVEKIYELLEKNKKLA